MSESRGARLALSPAAAAALLARVDLKRVPAADALAAITALRDHFVALADAADAADAAADAAAGGAGGDGAGGAAPAPPAASRKRPRGGGGGGGADDSSGWRAALGPFLDALALGVLGARRPRSAPAAAAAADVSARVAALKAYALLAVRAVPMRSHAAQGRGGPVLSPAVIGRLVRTLLAAGGRAAAAAAADAAAAAGAGAAAGSPARPPPALRRFLHSDLDELRSAVRAELCDDYDDARVAVLRAVKDAATERLAGEMAAAEGAGKGEGEGAGAGAGGEGEGEGGEGDDGGDAKGEGEGDLDGGAPPRHDASDAPPRARARARAAGGVSVVGDVGPRAAAAAASSAVFARNAVSLLLDVSVPPTLAAWEEDGGPDGTLANRSSLAGDAVGPSLGAWWAAARRAGAPAWRPDGDAPGGGGPAWATYAAQRRAYADAWLAVLRLPLPPDAARRVLLALPGRVLPLLPGRSPLLLADFLLAAVARGGAHALLAMESLLVLSQQHGLEVPRVYARLYALLGAPATPRSRYKARFFVLLDLFLSSPALPAYLVAAFAKRAARAALARGAPPAAARLAVGLLHNLLARHARALAPLLHREKPAAARGGNGGAGGGAAAAAAPSAAAAPPSPAAVAWPASADPFDAATDDPAAARAHESSLWELPALASHYAAPVAHAARALCEPSAGARAEVDMTEVAGADGGGAAGAGAAAGAAARAGRRRRGAGRAGAPPAARDASYAGMAAAELDRTVKVSARAGEGAGGGGGRGAGARARGGAADEPPQPAARVPAEVFWEHVATRSALEPASGALLAAVADFTA